MLGIHVCVLVRNAILYEMLSVRFWGHSLEDCLRALLRVILEFVGWVDSRHWKVPGRKTTSTEGQFVGRQFQPHIEDL